MRKLLLAAALSISFFVHGQADLSGSYGYLLEQPDNATKDEHAVPGGRLVLIKMENNLYRFWLDVMTKGPDFNRMETDGTLQFVNDTASFDNTFEDAAQSCILKFRKSGNTIVITTHGGALGCGSGLQANGAFTRFENQQKLDNNWLREQYPHAPLYKVTAAAAEFYQDQDGFRSFTPKRSFNKGETFLAIAETDKTVYTEMVMPDGTLRYGWLRKTDIKIKD